MNCLERQRAPHVCGYSSTGQVLAWWDRARSGPSTVEIRCEPVCVTIICWYLARAHYMYHLILFKQTNEINYIISHLLQKSWKNSIPCSRLCSCKLPSQALDPGSLQSFCSFQHGLAWASHPTPSELCVQKLTQMERGVVEHDVGLHTETVWARFS